MFILPPTHCPACSSTLEWQNDQLYCRNDSCPAKTQKQIEHFSKTLKIKGLGPSTIEKLELNDIAEIYDLDIVYLTLKLGSAKIAVKLAQEIERSKNEPLNSLLPAFGIPLVGKAAADKLSKVCSSIFDIDEFVCKKAGLGDKVTSNLLYWLETSFTDYVHLPFSFEFEEVATGQKGIVCITGKLKSFKTKSEARALLESLGYTVKDSLTKDVTILINESGAETDKTRKARDSGVLIYTNINALIGE